MGRHPEPWHTRLDVVGWLYNRTINERKTMKTIEEVLEFCRGNVHDLDSFVLANDSDSEYFSGCQSAYAQVIFFLTGEEVAVPEIPYPEM